MDGKHKSITHTQIPPFGGMTPTHFVETEH